MVKLNVSFADLLNLKEQGYVAYGNVLAPGKVIVKEQPWIGEVPPQLKNYAGKAGALARACKGRKGQAYVSCMRRKAVELGIAKKR